jgi:hypothetical protein
LDTSGWSINFKACDVKKTKSLVYPANFDIWNQRWVVVLSHRLTAQFHMKIIISAKDRCNKCYMITLMKIYANYYNIFTITMNFFASSLYIKTWEPLAHILIITKGSTKRCKINRENLQKKELQKHKQKMKNSFINMHHLPTWVNLPVIYSRFYRPMIHPSSISNWDYWTALVNTALMLFSNLCQPSSLWQTPRNWFFHPAIIECDLSVDPKQA